MFKLITKDFYIRACSVRISLFLITGFLLNGCSLSPAKPYSCESLEKWTDAIDAIQINPRSAFSAHYMVPPRVYPAFSDDIFITVFGESYFQLSRSELANIYESLNSCSEVLPTAQYVASAFKRLPDYSYYWKPHLTKAKKTSYESALAKFRGKKTATESKRRSLAYKKRKEIIAYNRRVDEKNRKIENALKGVGAAIIAYAAYDLLTHDSASEYKSYGSCAKTLGNRLTTCHIETGNCNIIGCDSNIKCDKGSWRSYKCEGPTASYGDHRSFFCDTETGDYSHNKETVIKSICLK